jgi:rRNA maturation RNase YbeY
MHINFFNEETAYSIRQKTLLRKWIADTIAAEKKVAGDLNIILCTDRYLHEMNMQYLNHDTLTDVITFDNSEGRQVSGDIFISLERVRENAKKYAKNIRDEIHRVIIHGVLHLCNYSDKSATEKEIMTQLENTYLAQRPLKLRAS